MYACRGVSVGVGVVVLGGLRRTPSLLEQAAHRLRRALSGADGALIEAHPLGGVLGAGPAWQEWEWDNDR